MVTYRRPRWAAPRQPAGSWAACNPPPTAAPSTCTQARQGLSTMSARCGGQRHPALCAPPLPLQPRALQATSSNLLMTSLPPGMQWRWHWHGHAWVCVAATHWSIMLPRREMPIFLSWSSLLDCSRAGILLRQEMQCGAPGT